MPLSGILFDLDNTLVDRAQSIACLAGEMAEIYSADLGDVEIDTLTQTIRTLDGGGYGDRHTIFDRLAEDIPWQHRPHSQDLRDFWYTTFPKCTRPMAGLYEVLDELRTRARRLGIVTNGSEASQSAKIDRLDIRDDMECVVVSESAGVSKPNPEIFALALAELGLSASDACFVGDHPDNDIAGAEAAGLVSIWFAGARPWPEDRKPPAFQIASLSDLIPLLDRMEE